MKKLLICMGILCNIMDTNAQKDEIAEFQRLNPSVEFISQDNYNSLSEEEIELINGKFILFKTTIEESDLTSFSQNYQQKSSQSAPELDTEMSDEQKNLVKIWLANHSEVKIVKHSEYEALSEEDKIVYLDNHCLILLSEILTLTDIELYPY